MFLNPLNDTKNIINTSKNAFSKLKMNINFKGNLDKDIYTAGDDEVIAQTLEFVKQQLSTDPTGHDWWHACRVWKNAKLIMQSEPQANKTVVELAALLHDVADWKFHNGDKTVGPKIAKDFLQSINVNDNVIEQVCEIISNVSFEGANVKSTVKTLEGQIVQDADRLDALGAIGIARTFAYGGYAGQEIYNPNKKPVAHNSFDEYKKQDTTTINHFYEKLLLLAARMNTQSAKKIAIKRQNFMQKYLSKFLSEWEGKS